VLGFLASKPLAEMAVTGFIQDLACPPVPGAPCRTFVPDESAGDKQLSALALLPPKRASAKRTRGETDAVDWITLYSVPTDGDAPPPRAEVERVADFCRRELARAAKEASKAWIPSLVDGFTPGERAALSAFFALARERPGERLFTASEVAARAMVQPADVLSLGAAGFPLVEREALSGDGDVVLRLGRAASTIFFEPVGKDHRLIPIVPLLLLRGLDRNGGAEAPAWGSRIPAATIRSAIRALKSVLSAPPGCATVRPILH
jgi:hypothetical protein